MYLPTYLFGEYADGKDATGQKLNETNILKAHDKVLQI